MMDPREVRKLINYAKKQGIKTLTVGEFSVTFQDSVVFPSRARSKNPDKIETDLIKKTAGIVASVTGETPTKEAKLVPAPDPVPGLDDINKFIYEDDEEQEAETA